MARGARIAIWAGMPLVVLGLAACSATDEMTTQAVQPAESARVAEPDCGSLKAEIDKLNTAKLPEKLQQAAAKKYSPSQDEWAAFPRYNNLVETYTAKKCEPALQQAGKAAKAKTAAVAKPVAKPAAAPKSTAQPAAAKAGATAAKEAAAPAKAAYEGVSIQIPQAPAEPKQQ